MADEQEQEQQEGQAIFADLLSPEQIKLRIWEGKQEAKRQHSYLNDDGVTENDAVVNRKLREYVRTARAESRPERGERSRHRDDVMAHMYSGVPGRSSWLDLPEGFLADVPEVQRAEVARGIYEGLDNEMWRKLSDEPDGVIQSSLEDGEFLCRTKVKTGKLDSVYVTSDKLCWETDLVGPRQAKHEKSGDSYAKIGRMVMERQPQHAPSVQREYKRTNQNVLDAGLKTMAPALDAAKAAKDNGGAEGADEK